MKHSPDHPEDLAVLARRGQLTSEQLEQLAQGLQGSAALRTADQVGRAFDRVAEVHEGDEQRIGEWVDRVVARRRAPAVRLWRRPWRGWRFGLVAAMVLVAASAAGVVGWRYSNRAEQAPARPAATAAPSPSKAAVARPRPGPVRSPEEQEPRIDPQEPAETPGPKRVRRSEPREPERSAQARTANQAEPRSQTPVELFSRANAARRKGHYDRAIASYSELQKLYPRSAEASMSFVSLGRLLLARGLAAKALEQFSHYLRGRGPLEQEALLGKARALAALGRRGEERAVWKRLLARYPGSLYAAEAKEQLGEVDRSSNP